MLSQVPGATLASALGAEATAIGPRPVRRRPTGVARMAMSLVLPVCFCLAARVSAWREEMQREVVVGVRIRTAHYVSLVPVTHRLSVVTPIYLQIWP